MEALTPDGAIVFLMKELPGVIHRNRRNGNRLWLEPRRIYVNGCSAIRQLSGGVVKIVGKRVRRSGSGASMIAFNCVHCQSMLKVETKRPGQKVKCPRC